jgi:hypothetical protein
MFDDAWFSFAAPLMDESSEVIMLLHLYFVMGFFLFYVVVELIW